MLTIEEIGRFIDNDKSSEKKRYARKGLQYYEGGHDIKDYKMYYVDADGKLQEDKLRSNIKISHPFFTELVDQQVQYMLSGDTSFIRSDDEKLQEALDDYFGDDFRAELQECLTGCIAKGFENMYACKSVSGRSRFITADSLGVIEAWGKDTDDGCDYVIYYYPDRIEKEKKVITRIEVWDANTTTYYVQAANNKIALDDSQPINPRPHITYTKTSDDALYYEGNGGYGFIPFFRLDNNRKQVSGLKPIKALIDDYDLIACGLSNNLQDIGEGLYVVKGFQGADLDEMMQNIKVKKHIGVDADGGVDIKTVDIPYDARKTKLELDEKNIYRFGMGFNSAQLGDGNITNIVIKSRYALLDLKSNKLEIRLQKMLIERKKELETVIEKANKYIDSAPEGRLEILVQNTHYRYYLCNGNAAHKAPIRSYIPKSESKLAALIAQRDYAKKLLNYAANEKSKIDALLKVYSPGKTQEIYENLHPGRKAIVTPILISDDEYARKWKASLQEAEFVNSFPVQSEIYTENNEHVRSKSEKIIADKLSLMGINQSLRVQRHYSGQKPHTNP